MWTAEVAFRMGDSTGRASLVSLITVGMRTFLWSSNFCLNESSGSPCAPIREKKKTIITIENNFMGRTSWRHVVKKGSRNQLFVSGQLSVVSLFVKPLTTNH